jgi:thioesterase domain-containing protein
MVDTPGPETELPRPIINNLEIVQRMFGDKASFNDPGLNDLNLADLIKVVVNKVNEKSGSEDLTVDFVDRCIRVAGVLEKAMFDYQPQPYPGGILFFRHSEPLAEFSRYPERPWLELAEAGVTVIKTPGNHYTMNLKPNVNAVAKVIKDRIQALR